MTAQFPTAKGLCNQSPKLFDSKYAGPFDKDEFLDDNPDASTVDIAIAEQEHTIRHLEVTSKCRIICAECPLLNECRDWVMDFNEPVWGVVGGMTERERLAAREGKNVSGDFIAESTESMDVLAMSQMLLGNSVSL